MIKKFLLSSFILLSLQSFAQEGTASPYSFNGIGEIKYNGTIENKSMGGLGILSDSVHLNLQNSASLSALRLTTYTIGGTFSKMTLKNGTSSESAKNSSLEYLAMAFPVGKFGIGIGLMPYSVVGYKIQKVVSDVSTSTYYGSGGVNKVFLGVGYKINSKLSLGLDFGYHFGKIEDIAEIGFVGVQYGTKEINQFEIAGMNFKAGLIYKSKIKKYDFISSFTISPTTNLSSGNTRIVTTNPYTAFFGGLEELDVPDSKIKLPTIVSFGAGLGDVKKWFVGIETIFKGSSSYGGSYDQNVTSNNASKFILGGYYTPNYNAYSKYYNKITYRAGIRYENTGLVINSESIRDSAVTLGLGFPVGMNFSSVNLGLEYGRRGTLNAGLIQENYLNLSVGLSFNDRWFVKRKFD